METGKKENHTSFAELYPELTPTQQAEAEYYLTRYVEVIQGIFERLQRQKLTESNPKSTMPME